MRNLSDFVGKLRTSSTRIGFPMEQFVEREEGIEASEYGGGTALLQLMSAELVYAVLSRVDALTLAKASCVSPEFRTLCADEGLWEKLCTARWPSTKEPHVKSIVSSMVSSSLNSGISKQIQGYSVVQDHNFCLK